MDIKKEVKKMMRELKKLADPYLPKKKTKEEIMDNIPIVAFFPKEWLLTNKVNEWVEARRDEGYKMGQFIETQCLKFIFVEMVKEK